MATAVPLTWNVSYFWIAEGPVEKADYVVALQNRFMGGNNKLQALLCKSEKIHLPSDPESG